MAPSTILSQTLHSITITKIQELEKQRRTYEKRKAEILHEAGIQTDLLRSVTKLHEGVEKLGLWHPDELQNIRLWIQQAENDPSVRKATLEKFKAQLQSRLEIESRKLSLANLHSRLITEWIGAPSASNSGFDTPESTLLDDPFEAVQDDQKDKLQRLRKRFEEVVFTPFHTEEVEIDNYLQSLFEGDSAQKALQMMRVRVASTGRVMREPGKPIDRQHLVWCIKALLKNELLNEEQKASLREFLRDESVITEIRDLLNMRYRDLENWSWALGERGMPIMPRQSLNGKWRVVMDEDILQAILAHYVGTSWAISLKIILKTMKGESGLWKGRAQFSPEDSLRRSFYLSPNVTNANESVEQERQNTYEEHFFMAPLPSKFFETGGYDDDDNDKNDSPKIDTERKTPKEIKQLLFRTLSSEIIVRRALDGQVAVIQSDFEWFAAGLPHSTVFAVLRFVGVQEAWINFFRKVLEAPMDMLNDGPVRTRKRGLPMAHIFEKLFGELVLFFLDLAVIKQADILLYRFHDDLWLVGNPQNCAKAWQTMQNFATIMGLKFNKEKTGSVYLVEDKGQKDQNIINILPQGQVAINFLTLDPSSGRWVIDQKRVHNHVEQLQKQLDGSNSVLEWVKIWNSCIGRFFSYTFGDPAQCFGRLHLDDVLATHKKLQQFLFNGNGEKGVTIIDHLKKLIMRRFEIWDIPDSFLYLPRDLGGLDLWNPFIPLYLVRENLCTDPENIIRDFMREEKQEYTQRKRRFESLSDAELKKRYTTHFPSNFDGSSNSTLSWIDARKFPTLEVYSSWREEASPLFRNSYKKLLEEPRQTEIKISDSIEKEIALINKVEALESDASLKEVNDAMFNPVMKWIIQYHEDELFEKFGGLRIVDKTLLPLGVLKAMQDKKVTWQMVL